MKKALLLFLASISLFSCSKSILNEPLVAKKSSKSHKKSSVIFASTLKSDSSFTKSNFFPLDSQQNISSAEASIYSNNGIDNTVSNSLKARYKNYTKEYTSKEVLNWKPAKNKANFISRIFKKNAPAKSQAFQDKIGTGLNKASCWVGIFAFCFSFLSPAIAIALGLIAVIMGLVGLQMESKMKSLAFLGIIAGVVAIGLGIIFGTIISIFG